MKSNPNHFTRLFYRSKNDTHRSLLFVSETCKSLTGYPSQEFIDNPSLLFQLIIPEDQKKIEPIIQKAIQTHQPFNIQYRIKHKDGHLLNWQEKGYAIYNTANKAVAIEGLVQEVSNSEKHFKYAINNVMDMIIQHEPLEKIGNKIITIIENAIPNCLGSILLLDKENHTLHNVAAPNVSKTFIKAIEGISIDQYKGSSSRAAHLKTEIIVSDIENNEYWNAIKTLAQAANLKACWSYPIFSSNKDVIGTFALYTNTKRKPSAYEKEIIFKITRVISIAIEQHHTTAALKQSTEKLAIYAEELENMVEERTNELKYMVQKLTETNLSLEDQIQETKIAERKVKHHKFLLENVSHNFPKGFVIVFDLNFKILLIEGEEIQGLGAEDVTDVRILIDTILDIPEEAKEKIKVNIEQTLGGEHRSFELNFHNRHYLVNTTPLLNINGKINQVLLVHNNITIQKETELEILKTLKKEQELSELKSRFISMASHEFRTPLSAILSSAILIKKLNAPGKEEKRLRHVSKIKSNVKNLVVILNDFLSLSKLEEGKIIAQPSTFNFIDFSTSILEELEGIKKHGQIIEFNYQQPQIEVYLDAKLMRHIIFNLLSNAIKYSADKQTITFKVSTEQQQLFVAITDQGIGIPKEDINHMFERFYRAANTTNIQGTGLGLNIVKQYTELMGGQIKIKSQLHKGSTFYVQFPLKMNDYEKNTIN